MIKNRIKKMTIDKISYKDKGKDKVFLQTGFKEYPPIHYLTIHKTIHVY